jgi:undecaprenyl diphosphate synthase
LSSKSSDVAGLNTSNLPRHVAIIMDGNGRWAQKRLFNRVKGHEKGAETVRMVANTCREFGITILTLYAFSTENWQRPQTEIAALMQLLKKFLNKEEAEMNANGIRLGVIGQPHRLPQDVRKVLERTMNSTAGNQGMLLNLALSYGGRAELTDMVRTIASKVVQGEFSPEAIDELLVARHLYTRDLPDPDILIRTGGEMRISNFMLWQLAYTEFFITRTLWPDFSKDEFIGIIEAYQGRERRFGKVVDA